MSAAVALEVLEGVHSPELGNQRDVLVYVPPSYHRSDRAYPVLYMQDGQNLFDPSTSYAGEWGVGRAMNSAARRGLEAIVVGVPNMTFRVYPTALIEENKWRAVRYGLDGRLVDLGKDQELPARTLVRELLEWFVDDVLDELGSRKEVEYAFTILDQGTSADRQIARFRQTGDLKAVVDSLIAETADGVVDSVEPVPAVRR